MPVQARQTASGRAHEGFRAQMRALLAEVKARGDPAPGDQSIGGLLLRLRDPRTGALTGFLVAAAPERFFAGIHAWCARWIEWRSAVLGVCVVVFDSCRGMRVPCWYGSCLHEPLKPSAAIHWSALAPRLCSLRAALYLDTSTQGCVTCSTGQPDTPNCMLGGLQSVHRGCEVVVGASSGERLPDDRVAAEFGVVYQGGTESTSLTIAWAMCATLPESPDPDLCVLPTLGTVHWRAGDAALLQSRIWCFLRSPEHRTALSGSSLGEPAFRSAGGQFVASNIIIWQDTRSMFSVCVPGRSFMISMHPAVEAKVLAELDAHGLLVTAQRPTPRQLDWEDLGKLTYTNHCIKARRRHAHPCAATLDAHPP